MSGGGPSLAMAVCPQQCVGGPGGVGGAGHPSGVAYGVTTGLPADGVDP